MHAEIEGRPKSDIVRHIILCSFGRDAHEIKGGAVNICPIESSFSITCVGP